MRTAVGYLLAVAVLSGCTRERAASTNQEPTAAADAPGSSEPRIPGTDAPGSSALREVFPFIRVDAKARLVEFDGVVPVDVHDPATPDVYLELVACTPDTREHESLVMTRARPSHVHAALLAIGLEPGSPGSWSVSRGELVKTAPTGPMLDVTIAYHDGAGREVEAPAWEWIVSARTDRPILPAGSPTPFLFAGSKMAVRQGREGYDADGTGTLIGLTTFGMETIAWREVISPEAALEEPEWLADRSRVPRFGTPVVVRIQPGR